MLRHKPLSFLGDLKFRAIRTEGAVILNDFIKWGEFKKVLLLKFFIRRKIHFNLKITEKKIMFKF